MKPHRKNRPAVRLCLLLGALPTLLLCSCAPTVVAPQPEFPLPAQFSSTGEEEPAQRWWTSFADPQLNGLIELALSDNPGLQATWQRLQQAAATARKSGAEGLPTLNLEGGAGRTKSLGDGQSDSGNIFSLGLNAAYEIDLWGRIAAARDAADLDVQASAAELQTAALTLTTQVATGWYQLLEKRGQLQLLEAQLQANEQLEELIRVQVRIGKTGVADLLQQQQLMESVRGEAALVAADIAVLEHRLTILCGRPPQQPVTMTTAPLPALPPRPSTRLPLSLIQRRPDLRAAFAAVQAADRRVAAAIADRFPRLSLSARLSASESRVSDLFDNWLATLAANLVGPLTDGGKRRAEVDRTRAAAQAALHNYSAAALTALGEVEDALSREERQQRYLESLTRQLEYSSTVLGNLRDRYTRGAADYERVLSALLARQRLERSQLQARRDLLINRVALYSALSGGWTTVPLPPSNERQSVP